MAGTFGQQHGSAWPQNQQAQAPVRNNPQRQPFGQADGSYRSMSMSDRSGSANEVENMLLNPNRLASRTSDQGGWSVAPQKNRTTQRGTVFTFAIKVIYPVFTCLQSSLHKPSRGPQASSDRLVECDRFPTCKLRIFQSRRKYVQNLDQTTVEVWHCTITSM